MASVKIDRTDKPFEAGVLYKKEVGTLTPPPFLPRRSTGPTRTSTPRMKSR